ncbi:MULTISPECIES: aldehyde dehydrogenase (NADP(+)) [unclassified Pseudomonas]|uniref:aldehyde dehydrogenase (NADP(+)) n=1 Tax=unclassified Pseudomonas TaxID=196821 RepID=UPI001CBB5605|nr:MULTISPECIES: aldehyde dehydrogenase (NADP(+)) [unclassified Pseudomonas]
MTEISILNYSDAVELAHDVSAQWAASSAEQRIALLNGLAEALFADANRLALLANEETNLGIPRLLSELERTCFQLRGFAQQVAERRPFRVVDDAATPGVPPYGRPHVMKTLVPLGPVAMFSASNFPFAFSVLGGDTASALAAGCTVVVKAHSGHPRLSREVFFLAQRVLRELKLESGVIQFVEGAGHEVGVGLVRHPHIKAVAFTGSYQGGTALWREANARETPIPFYGELGSINPVVILPAALEHNPTELGMTLSKSIEFGCGQICTSPGVVVLFEGERSEAFVAGLSEGMQTHRHHLMLTPGMKHNFVEGVHRIKSVQGVDIVLDSLSTEDAQVPPTSFLARTTGANFIHHAELREEVFGPACLIVSVQTHEEILKVLRCIGGSLTTTIWGLEEDTVQNREILRAASQVAGRVLFSGVPTGVAICRAQVHGGPWPSSTMPLSTSVGYAALERFLRPIALQGAPEWVASLRGQPC